jgi:hypothetical protein
MERRTIATVQPCARFVAWPPAGFDSANEDLQPHDGHAWMPRFDVIKFVTLDGALAGHSHEMAYV